MTLRRDRRPQTLARLAEVEAELVDESDRVKAARPRRRRPPEPELSGRALERLVDETLAELARGQAELEGERTCCTCSRVRGCALLGRSLTRAPATSSRRRTVAGCCTDWQQQQDHQTASGACPADMPAHTCDP